MMGTQDKKRRAPQVARLVIRPHKRPSNFTRCAAAFCASMGLLACAAPTGGALSNERAQATASAPPSSDDCHAQPDPAQAQYIIGYGSLMQDESRKRTSPQAGPAHPVEVVGYRRGWFAKGASVGFSTTFLGVLPDPNARLNAVIYRVQTSELTATDQRESFYCRISVSLSSIKALETTEPESRSGQAWIYVNRPESIATPSPGFPIVQSYVDIFVSGCLEQEERFELKGFAQQCLATTADWSVHWVNDRLYPRRPFIYQPKAGRIDSLLTQQLPAYFSRIRIE
jgi:hypothetical protein